MRGRIGAIMLLMAITCGFPAHAQQGNLIMAFGDFNDRPYAIIENNEISGGVLFDLGCALADRMGLKAHFRHLPRNRIGPELISGNIDLYCLAGPDFYPGFPVSAFSTPIFVENNIMIFAQGYAGATTLEAMEGTRIGTVLGYNYAPLIEALFKNGRGIREDARTATANLRKLANGRLDAVILPSLVWRNAIHQNPELAKAVRPEKLILTAQARTCLVSPASAVSVEEVNRALEIMRNDGSLAHLINQHGLTTASKAALTDNQAAKVRSVNPADHRYR
jgi:polar amino acid transport system substrate-binding protein